MCRGGKPLQAGSGVCCLCHQVMQGRGDPWRVWSSYNGAVAECCTKEVLLHTLWELDARGDRPVTICCCWCWCCCYQASEAARFLEAVRRLGQREGRDTFNKQELQVGVPEGRAAHDVSNVPVFGLHFP
jgi:hypothetical protein